MAISLPFFRNSSELPAPLPTKQEIHDSATILKGTETWATQKVVVVGQHFLVKYGSRTSQIEGDNLLFIEQNLRIPAPRLYAMWQELDGVMYIVMEFISGDTLESLWPNLTESNKTTIMKKLRSVFEQIRSLPSPGFYGNVSGGCLPYHLFWIAGNKKSVSGPFKSERDLLLGLAEKSRINSANNNRHSYMADFIERQLSRAFGNDHLPTFSHSDLQRKNIIVREIPSGDKNTSTEETHVVSIVDWEVAGWYPSYWEYAAAFFAFKWEDDWLERVEEVIDAWSAETAMIKMVYQDLWL